MWSFWLSWTEHAVQQFSNQSELFTHEPELLAHESELLAYEPELFANKPELQPIFAAIVRIWRRFSGCSWADKFCPAQLADVSLGWPRILACRIASVVSPPRAPERSELLLTGLSCTASSPTSPNFSPASPV